MPRRKPTLTKGDYVAVHWIDINSDSTGDPSKADIERCVTNGFYVGERTVKEERVVIIAYTLHSGEISYQSGWECYPKSVVRSIELVKKHDSGV